MSSLRYTLVADGTGDRALCAALEWILARHTSRVTVREVPDLGRLRRPPRTLADKLTEATKLAPCDLLFVHRDAEGQSADRRRKEIQAAVRVGGAGPHVPVIPVRMTEAWLVWAEQAIRQAAGNPKGRDPLHLPSPSRVGTLPDPKADLRTALRTASGLHGRRLDGLRTAPLTHRVAECIGDYSPLLAAPAFAKLDEDVAELVAQQRW